MLRRPVLTQLGPALGLHDLKDVPGGYQSLGVYAARLGDRDVILKLVDAGLVDRRSLQARVDMLIELGAANATVCRPVTLAGRLINECLLGPTSTAYAVAYEFAEGDSPVVGDPAQGRLMGEVLAGLHAALARLPSFDLPALAAFPSRSRLIDVATEIGVPIESLVDASEVGRFGPVQLVHGDFSAGNVRLAQGVARVFDFDDCGYGAVQLDVAQSLYMVLFDALTGDSLDRYRTFRDGFVSAYRSHSRVDVQDTNLDALITYRVVVLASWLASPETAPIGIRTSPAHWRAALARFVARYVETVA